MKIRNPKSEIRKKSETRNPKGEEDRCGIAVKFASGCQAGFERQERTSACLPLTPALSLGEREQAGPVLHDRNPAAFAAQRTTILPLPQGEGRGEGEAATERNGASNRITPFIRYLPLFFGFRPSDFFRSSDFGFRIFILFSLGLFAPQVTSAPSSQSLFQQGSQAYITGGFPQAAASFREAVAAAPSAGGFHNLGNAEWQCQRPGPAILAWERAQWLNPFNANTRANLRYARKAVRLDTADLAWYEVCSTWLPVNAWAWLASLSLWLAVAMVALPGILRWRKADWHQALAAAGFAVFLLTLPALLGVHTRAKLGILLPKETPVRLTPTQEAQILSKLPAGETARLERERGGYVFIRAAGAAGWVERSQFGLVAAASEKDGKL